MAHSADMATRDPHGILLTLTSVTIVFLVIVSLIFAYSLIGKLLNRQSRPDKEERKNGPSEKEAAAIALALELHMKEEQHDDESYVITIKR